jgi:TetR/AcrR family transcriptional repressor of mexJK operon
MGPARVSPGGPPPAGVAKQHRRASLAGADGQPSGQMEYQCRGGHHCCGPVLQMRTLIAAEAQRFPDVAADYVTRSWTRNIRTLAEALGALTARGLLRIDDPGVAAEQLTWLVVAAPLNRLTLQDGAHPYAAGELESLATQGVTTFLSRYGPEDMDRQ